jgi:hypothetical protein
MDGVAAAAAVDAGVLERDRADELVDHRSQASQVLRQRKAD